MTARPIAINGAVSRVATDMLLAAAVAAIKPLATLTDSQLACACAIASA